MKIKKYQNYKKNRRLQQNRNWHSWGKQHHTLGENHILLHKYVQNGGNHPKKHAQLFSDPPPRNACQICGIVRGTYPPPSAPLTPTGTATPPPRVPTAKDIPTVRIPLDSKASPQAADTFLLFSRGSFSFPRQDRSGRVGLTWFRIKKKRLKQKGRQTLSLTN